MSRIATPLCVQSRVQKKPVSTEPLTNGDEDTHAVSPARVWIELDRAEPLVEVRAVHEVDGVSLDVCVADTKAHCDDEGEGDAGDVGDAPSVAGIEPMAEADSLLVSEAAADAVIEELSAAGADVAHAEERTP